MSEMEDFFNEFTQDLLASVGSEGGFTKGRFVDQMCSMFVDQGVIPSYVQTNDKPGRGMDLDAWCHNEELNRLTLFICDHRPSGKLESLSQKQIEIHFKRLTNLVEACHKDSFLEKLEEASDVTDFALFIRERYQDIRSVHLVLLSNARISGRVNQLPGADLPKDRVIDGVDMRPALAGKPLERPVPLYWRNHVAPTDNHVALRIGEWKIVGDKALEKFQLYKIEEDWKEEKDLAAKMPEKLASMKAALLKVHGEVEREGPSEWWINEPPRKRGKRAARKTGKELKAEEK